MVDELDRGDPPPGWLRYTVTDDDGCRWASQNVKRDEPPTASLEEAWAKHDGGDFAEKENVRVWAENESLRAKLAASDRAKTAATVALKRLRAEAITRENTITVEVVAKEKALAQRDAWAGRADAMTRVAGEAISTIQAAGLKTSRLLQLQRDAMRTGCSKETGGADGD